MSGAPRAGGYIKLARKMFDGHDVYWADGTPFDSRSAWTDLIQMAAYQPYLYRGVDALERGEFVAAVRYLAQRWKWSKSAVQRWLATGTKLGRIEGRRMGHHGRIYLLVGYDTYQGDVPEGGTASGTPDEKQRDEVGTNKKTVKQYKRATLSSASPDEQRVLDHYVRVHPRRRPGDKELKATRRGFALGYSADELCEAIDGNAADDWHREKGKHELSYVFRDNGKIDDFRARAEQSRPVSVVDPKTGLLNLAGLSIAGRRSA